MTGPAGALRVVSLAERPDLRDALSDHQVAAWPELMLEDPIASRTRSWWIARAIAWSYHDANVWVVHDLA